MKHPHTQKIQIVTRIRSETALPKNLRLVESRHFPAFFSFVSIDPESAIMFHRVPSSQFDRFQSTYKQSKTNHFCFLFSVVRYRFFLLFSLFYDRFGFSPDKKMKNRSQFTTNSSKIKFLITRKHIYTQQKKGDSHTQENKRQHQQNESILRARNKMVLFFSF